jgi:hypothetical protein
MYKSTKESPSQRIFKVSVSATRYASSSCMTCAANKDTNATKAVAGKELRTENINGL